MADYKGAILTNSGADMQGHVLAEDRLVYTHAAIGSAEIPRRRDIQDLHRVPGHEMRAAVRSVESLGNGTAKVRIAFDNRGVRQGFNIRSIGLYARVDHIEIEPFLRNLIRDWHIRYDHLLQHEIREALALEFPDITLRPYVLPTLYAVAYSENPDFLPPYNSQTAVEYEIDIVTIVGDTTNVGVQLTREADVQKAVKPILRHQQFARPGETVEIKISNYIEDHLYLFSSEQGHHVVRRDTILWSTPMSPNSSSISASVQSLAPGLSASEKAILSIAVRNYRDTVAAPDDLWPKDGRSVLGRTVLRSGNFDAARRRNHHIRSKFLVSDDNQFLGASREMVSRDKSAAVPRTALNEGEMYYWMAKHFGSSGMWSDWSVPNSFLVRDIFMDFSRASKITAPSLAGYSMAVVQAGVKLFFMILVIVLAIVAMLLVALQPLIILAIIAVAVIGLLLIAAVAGAGIIGFILVGIVVAAVVVIGLVLLALLAGAGVVGAIILGLAIAVVSAIGVVGFIVVAIAMVIIAIVLAVVGIIALIAPVFYIVQAVSVFVFFLLFWLVELLVNVLTGFGIIPVLSAIPWVLNIISNIIISAVGIFSKPYAITMYILLLLLWIVWVIQIIPAITGVVIPLFGQIMYFVRYGVYWLIVIRVALPF